jgi:hypothetical protein
LDDLVDILIVETRFKNQKVDGLPLYKALKAFEYGFQGSKLLFRFCDFRVGLIHERFELIQIHSGACHMGIISTTLAFQSLTPPIELRSCFLVTDIA